MFCLSWVPGLCWHSVHFLLLCDILASYCFSVFVFNGSEKCFIYDIIFFAENIRVFWRKSYGLDWLGCGVCSGVTSSPADLPPPLIILCVFATCVWTHMFLPLALFHCDVLNTGFLPSDHESLWQILASIPTPSTPLPLLLTLLPVICDGLWTLNGVANWAAPPWSCNKNWWDSFLS